MVKFATALRLGTAETEVILRRFTRKGPQHPTYKALAELGKAVKTIFLCDFLHSLELRREIHEELNVIENWNSANSFIFYARSSEIATNNREEQEIAVLSMHLLQMCMVYINTLMIQQVLAEPDWQNRLEPEDLRALTPLIYAHVNPYGRFIWIWMNGYHLRISCHVTFEAGRAHYNVQPHTLLLLYGTW